MGEPIVWIENIEFEIDGDGVFFASHSSGRTIYTRTSRHAFRFLIERGRRALDEADRESNIRPFKTG